MPNRLAAWSRGALPSSVRDAGGEAGADALREARSQEGTVEGMEFDDTRADQDQLLKRVRLTSIAMDASFNDYAFSESFVAPRERRPTDAPYRTSLMSALPAGQGWLMLLAVGAAAVAIALFLLHDQYHRRHRLRAAMLVEHGLAVHGLDVQRLSASRDASLLGDAGVRCAACREQPDCTAALAAHDASQSQLPHNCPNGPLFDLLVRRYRPDTMSRFRVDRDRIAGKTGCA